MIDIKKFRKTNNLTQKQFAEKVGVCQATVSAWEVNKAKPTKEHERNIKKAINMIETYKMANMYYDALSRVSTKPRFSWKRKLLKLLIVLLIVLILTVLY